MRGWRDVQAGLPPHDRLRDDAELWDSVEDTAHVAGAALAVAGAWEAGLVQAIFYGSGILRRRAERDAN